MERHTANAQVVAEHLKDHKRVSWVSYAGLPDSPYFELAQKCTGGRPSGLVSFGIKGGYEPGQRFYDALKMFKRLVNIGDVRSLAAHPAIGAWLIQCSDLPPYAASLRRATGLPVFDMVTLIEHIGTALRPREFAGQR